MVGDGDHVESRIDRALANAAFQDHWSLTRGLVLVRNCSDHNPIAVLCSLNDTNGPKPFRFQAMWTLHSDFLRLVESSWNEPLHAAHPQLLVMRKQRRLKTQLKDWNRIPYTHLPTMDKNVFPPAPLSSKLRCLTFL